VTFGSPFGSQGDSGSRREQVRQGCGSASVSGKSGIGPGQWSIDHVLGWFDPPGWIGLGLALIPGLGGAAALLAIFWRPVKAPASPAAVDSETAEQS
jgi:hypothetical protein